MTTKTRRESSLPLQRSNILMEVVVDLCRDTDLSLDARESLANLAVKEWPILIDQHRAKYQHVLVADALQKLLDGTVTRPMDETCKLVLDAIVTLPNSIRYNIRRALAGAKDRKSLLIAISEFETQLRVGETSRAREDAETFLLGRRPSGD